MKDFIIKCFAPIKRMGLNNRDFSIISNNCWGGIIYRDFHIPYNSPTCGLYFFAEDYINFVSNLNYYLKLELSQINIHNSKYCDILSKNHGDELIIGTLGDVEIVFLHYKTFEEAKDKWDRRARRINYDNLLVKFSDQNLFKEEYFDRFKKLDYKNKVFITTNIKYKSDFTYVIKDKNNDGYAKDDIRPSFKIMNIKKVLNEMKRGK